jgi:hypothetical protein
MLEQIYLHTFPDKKTEYRAKMVSYFEENL